VELAQAAETTVDMQDVLAQSVRITAQSNWVGLFQKFGLSEVRLYAIPNAARKLSPADGAANVDPTTAVLTWRDGREADVHKLYISTDEQAVIDGTAPAVTLPEALYAPDLALDTTNYWRVDEVNDLEDPNVWAGPVQSFSTTAYIVVDDMEFYSVYVGEEFFATWEDGYDKPANGALVGHGFYAEPETQIVHDGAQSMPLYYGEDGASVSETTRPFAPAEDWSKYGIQSLSLYFYGSADNTGGQLYVKINNGTPHNYQGAATDIQTAQWFPFTIDLTGVTVVNSLTIGVTGGSGMVIIDDIRLYSQASELITPVAPDATELLASYSFEGNYQDGSGNGLHGAAVGAAAIISDAQRGSVLSLDGVDSCVDLGPSGDPNQGFNFPGSFSLSAWVNITSFTSNWSHAIMGNRGESNVGWQLRRHSSTSNLTFTVRGTEGADDPQGTVDVMAVAGEWLQVTAIYDAEAGLRNLYVNGLLDVSIADSGVCAATTHNVYIGARANGANSGPEAFFNGMIDDVRIYNRSLSKAEVLGLTGRTAPMYKAF